MDWVKGVKEADDEVIVSKTGAKTKMARRDWSKPLHESGRSLFGVPKRRMARIDWPGKSGGRFWAGKNLKAHLNSKHKTFIVLFPLLSLHNVQISVDISEN